jgi:hypothetical protein
VTTSGFDGSLGTTRARGGAAGDGVAAGLGAGATAGSVPVPRRAFSRRSSSSILASCASTSVWLGGTTSGGGDGGAGAWGSRAEGDATRDASATAVTKKRRITDSGSLRDARADGHEKRDRVTFYALRKKSPGPFFVTT